MRAALARAARGGRISAEAFTQAREAFVTIWDRIEVIELDERVGRLAAGASESYASRSHDAVQLASALQLQDSELTLIALDDRLRRAAGECGLAVTP